MSNIISWLLFFLVLFVVIPTIFLFFMFLFFKLLDFISNTIDKSGKISIVKQGDYFLIEKDQTFFDKRYLGRDYWWKITDDIYYKKFTTAEEAENHYQEYLRSEQINSSLEIIKKLKN